MLYDLDYKRIVDPAYVEDMDPIPKLKKEMHPTTFQKCIQTLDTGLVGLKPSKASALVWTKLGALMGERSIIPQADFKHFWDNMGKFFGHEEILLIASGTLFRWRIALLAETTEEIWLLWREKREERNRKGELIKISNYWIDNDFQLPKKNSLDDLQKKFNQRGI